MKLPWNIAFVLLLPTLCMSQESPSSNTLDKKGGASASPRKTDKRSVPISLNNANPEANINLAVPKGFCNRFGKPFPGKCDCSQSPANPICGSDLENYPNECEFECAFKCNPRLNRYAGECPKNGGLPKKPRLNYTKKERLPEDENAYNGTVADGDPTEDDDFEDPVPVAINPHTQNRGLLGYALDEFSFRNK